MLERIDYNAENDIFHTDDLVIQQLMVDYELTDLKASDLYFSSHTYSLLINESNELYKKPWIELYKLVIHELKLK